MPTISPDSLPPADLANRVATLMLDKLAKEVLLIDLRGLTSVTDYFVIGSGESETQVKTIVDHVNEILRAAGQRPHHIEGYDKRSWVILDYVSVVVHVFMPHSRDYYGLERLWADAPISEIAD